MSEHREESTSEIRRGVYYEVRIECACGDLARSGLSTSRDTALRQAQDSFGEHLPHVPPPAEAARSAEERKRFLTTALACVGATLIVVVVAALVLGGRAVITSRDGEDTQADGVNGPLATAGTPSPTPSNTSSVVPEPQGREAGEGASKTSGPAPTVQEILQEIGIECPRLVERTNVPRGDVSRHMECDDPAAGFSSQDPAAPEILYMGPMSGEEWTKTWPGNQNVVHTSSWVLIFPAGPTGARDADRFQKAYNES